MRRPELEEKMRANGGHLPHRGPMRHGTRSMYVNADCRCDACRGANRDYFQTHPRERRMKPDTEDRWARSLTVDSTILMARAFGMYQGVMEWV